MISKNKNKVIIKLISKQIITKKIENETKHERDVHLIQYFTNIFI